MGLAACTSPAVLSGAAVLSEDAVLSLDVLSSEVASLDALLSAVLSLDALSSRVSSLDALLDAELSLDAPSSDVASLDAVLSEETVLSLPALLDDASLDVPDEEAVLSPDVLLEVTVLSPGTLSSDVTSLDAVLLGVGSPPSGAGVSRCTVSLAGAGAPAVASGAVSSAQAVPATLQAIQSASKALITRFFMVFNSSFPGGQPGLVGPGVDIFCMAATRQRTCLKVLCSAVCWVAGRPGNIVLLHFQQLVIHLLL